MLLLAHIGNWGKSFTTETQSPRLCGDFLPDFLHEPFYFFLLIRSRQEISWSVGLAILFPGKERRMRIALVL